MPEMHDDRVIISLPAEANALNPRLLQYAQTSLAMELQEILPKINAVVSRGCPKMHLAVAYLADSVVNKYGISAQCQSGYVDINQKHKGIALILDLPRVTLPNLLEKLPLENNLVPPELIERHVPVASGPELSPKSNATFAAKLKALLKQGKMPGSRCSAVLPSLESPRDASESWWNKELSPSRSLKMAPVLVNNLVW